jgi:patatin-like phospholipase/acyl hydrolase
MSSYRILSLDGGGIRGLITAILLERLEEAHPSFLSHIDLFAGTSTGGLLALGLASGLSPKEIRSLYEEMGKRVFTNSFLDDILDMGNLIGAEYSIGPLKRALEIRFGDKRLGDLPKKVLVSSFDLDNCPQDKNQLRTWKAKFFHNYPGLDSDSDQKVVDVALRTSNAPTYFPVYQGYIDGGVVASNPSVCAMAQALHPLTGGQDLTDIVLLSLGTGHNPRFLPQQHGDWGLLHWAPHMVNLALEGSASLADYQCRQILDNRYFRINPVLPYPIGMDEVDKIPQMIEIAIQLDLDGAIQWINKHYLS